MVRRFSISFFLLVGLIAIPMTSQEDPEVTEEPSTQYYFEFPLAPPSQLQIEEAFACQLVGSNPDAIQEGVEYDAGCIYANATLIAHYLHTGDSMAEDEVKYFVQLFGVNPALPHRLDFVSKYFNTLSLVAPPAFTSQPIIELRLDYTWYGLGDQLHYDLLITIADAKPLVSGDISFDTYGAPSNAEETPEPLTLPDTIDSGIVQAFGPALSDLTPVGHMFSLVHCTDRWPDWVVTLRFAGGEVVEMVTNGSNIIGAGGPWQTEIDDQVYMQYSSAFILAIGDLFDALGLRFGTTLAGFCPGDMQDPLRAAFSRTG